MAIHPTHPGLEVTVVVNGEKSKEYDDGSDTSLNTAKRYVESTTGANFHVNFDFRQPFPARPILARLIIDGQELAHRYMLTRGVVGQNGKQYSIKGAAAYVGSIPALREFQFSSLASAESNGETITPDMIQKLQSIGRVKVELRLARVLMKLSTQKLSGNKMHSRRGVEKLTMETYNEKAAKGNVISHMVGLGPAKAVEGHGTPKPRQSAHKPTMKTYYESDANPFVVFDFQYRSLDALKSLHIIPRTPEPTDSMDIKNVNIGGRDPGEMQHLLGRLQQQHKAQAKVAQFQIKAECARSVKMEKTRSADVIDQDEVVFTRSRPTKRRVPERRLPQEGDLVIELD